MIDGTIIKVHRRGTGAKGALRSSHRPFARWANDEDRPLVDALGYLARVILLPGQRHDSVGVEPLVENIDFEAPIANKAFDNDALRRELDERGAMAVIPQRAIAKRPFHMTPRPTNGGICRDLHPAPEKNGDALQRATTRPTQAFAAFIYLSAALRAIA